VLTTRSMLRSPLSRYVIHVDEVRGRGQRRQPNALRPLRVRPKWQASRMDVTAVADDIALVTCSVCERLGGVAPALPSGSPGLRMPIEYVRERLDSLSQP
jgi:hypothetical protein